MQEAVISGDEQGQVGILCVIAAVGNQHWL